MNSNPITVTSKPIATKVTNDSTGKEVTGPVQQGEKVTISANIPNTTSGSSSSSSSSSMGGKVTYQ
ncbi:hypothetical protein J6W20_03770 [bacterium]|nr:hypothetical protein [bacterium]